MVRVLIDWCQDHHVLINWNLALKESCRSGHLFSAQLAIDHGANDWDGGLEEATRGHQRKPSIFDPKDETNGCHVIN